MIIERINRQLDKNQSPEQAGFRSGFFTRTHFNHESNRESKGIQNRDSPYICQLPRSICFYKIPDDKGSSQKAGNRMKKLIQIIRNIY